MLAKLMSGLVHCQWDLKGFQPCLRNMALRLKKGAVEKVSRLAEEIIEIIAHKRKRVSPPGYYHRRIE